MGETKEQGNMRYTSALIQNIMQDKRMVKSGKIN